MKKLIFSVLFLASSAAMAEPMNLAQKQSIDSKAMNGVRDIYIHTPDGYSQNSGVKYPVLYLLDAQDNFIHAMSAAKVLADAQAGPQLLVVGVPSVDRRGDLGERGAISNADKPSRFAKFLVEEVVPYIDKNYRTENYRMLSGHSASGGYVVETLLADNDTFNAYLAFSPALNLGAADKLPAMLDKRLKSADHPLVLVMTMADEGPDFAAAFEQLQAAFKGRKALNISAMTLADENHATSAQVAQFQGLKILFNGWTPSEQTLVQGLGSMQKHYKELSQRFGFEVALPMDMVYYTVYNFAAGGQPQDLKKASELISYALDADQDTVNTFANMAQGLGQQGMGDEQKAIVGAVCKKVSQHEICKVGSE